MEQTSNVNLTVDVQTILNFHGQKYTVKSNRIAAYEAFLAANPEIAATPVAVAKNSMVGRVPSNLAAWIRGGVGYDSIPRAWDWPRGILALIIAKGDAQEVRQYGLVRG
jgi:hypothetical protein